MGPVTSKPRPPGGAPTLLGVIARPLLYGLVAAAGQMVITGAGAAELGTLNALLWYTY
ncbi:hypothetical protein HL658_34980 [Azospirillum sp. RWY-5-1]|uniref:MATE family efflux transporter n=1 Tax=Azospirillum oleiclasticum TaxID=2735135 RepID=A0ABX2TBA5_9PROT|nr:hypothetical protein [Azospirillum oleiclasticum]NYZ17777.1 hypothetical protein [Azospirillum oleiclasticum]NYZ21466.1 hypothetical protein [Azospirillum oleiclasticum]